MYSVTRIIEFCYGHRLLHYEGKCRYLHGHNGKAEIELSRDALDERGMVRDFEEIKQTIQSWIDRELDHKMLLNRRDPIAAVLQQRGEPVFLLEANPTAEAIAELIFNYAASQGLPVTSVRMWETARSVATYRPERTARGRRLPPGRIARPPRRSRMAGRRGRRRATRSTSTAA